MSDLFHYISLSPSRDIAHVGPADHLIGRHAVHKSRPSSGRDLSPSRTGPLSGLYCCFYAKLKRPPREQCRSEQTMQDIARN